MGGTRESTRNNRAGVMGGWWGQMEWPQRAPSVCLHHMVERQDEFKCDSNAVPLGGPRLLPGGGSYDAADWKEVGTSGVGSSTGAKCSRRNKKVGGYILDKDGRKGVRCAGGRYRSIRAAQLTSGRYHRISGSRLLRDVDSPTGAMEEQYKQTIHSSFYGYLPGSVSHDARN